MLMKFGNGQGWANASGADVELLKANGWVESSEEERSEIIEKKIKSINEKTVQKVDTKEVEKHVTIAPQQEVVKGRPGRKPKNHLLGGVDGNDSKQGK